MRVTIHQRGSRYAYKAFDGLVLSGDPTSYDGICDSTDGVWSAALVQHPDGFWIALVRDPTASTRLDGRLIAVGDLVRVEANSILEIGEVTVSFGYLDLTLERPKELTDIERDLLARIAEDDDDDDARAVLADYWQEHGHEVRGAVLAMQCRGEEDAAHALLAERGDPGLVLLQQAGFSRRPLRLQRGFLPPLLLDPSLAGHPDLYRISPQHYAHQRVVSAGTRFRVVEARALTPAREGDRVAIKMLAAGIDEYDPAAGYDMPNSLEREWSVLERIDHPNVVRLCDVAIGPRGFSLVLDWRGRSLAELIHDEAQQGRNVGEKLAIELGIQVCRALTALHANKIVHGEIAPEHVLVADDGHASIVSFHAAATRVMSTTTGDYRALAAVLFHATGLQLDDGDDVTTCERLSPVLRRVLAEPAPSAAFGAELEKLLAGPL